jgi:hypothetical protein
MNNCPLGDKYKLKMSLAKKDGPCTGFYEKDDNSGVCSRCPACEKCSFLDPLAVSPVGTFYVPMQQQWQQQAGASPYVWYSGTTSTTSSTTYPYDGGGSYDSSWWVTPQNGIYKEEEE